MTNKVLYIAKMYEDGKVHLTEPFETIKEAKAAGKGRWLIHGLMLSRLLITRKRTILTSVCMKRSGIL